MNAFAVAASALLVGLLPLGVVALRRRAIDGLVALEAAGALVVLATLCLAEAFHRSTYFTVAVIAAPMSWIGGLVFARFLGRWL